MKNKLVIGLYKPYKSILFNDAEDTSSWSREIVNFAKIFAEHGHEIILLSTTDYATQNIAEVKGIKKLFGGILKGSLNDCPDLDVLIVFNGVFEKDKIHEKFLLGSFSCPKVLMATDLNLATSFHDTSKYDVVISQTKRKFCKNAVYGHLEKLILYDEKIDSSYCYRIRATQNSGVFAGHERDRIDELLEFVVRPGMDWFGKSATLNFSDKIGKAELVTELRSHLYSIVISDPLYYKNAFVTQRYYENCAAGIINFVSNEFDKDELIIRRNDWRRVKNYIELRTKVHQLDQEKFDALQKKQFHEVLPWISGRKIYKILHKQICGVLK